MRTSAPIVLLFLVLIPLSALSQNPSATPPNHQQFLQKLVAAAIDRTHHIVRYDPAYVRIPYPNGDVPPDTGVCTMKLFGHIAPLELTCKKKFTRTWCAISRRIQINGVGFLPIRTQALITAAFPI